MDIEEVKHSKQVNKKSKRVPDAFIDDEFNADGEGFEEDQLERQNRLERMRQTRLQQSQDHIKEVLDFEDVRGKRSEWVQRPEVIRWIRKVFGDFLRSFHDEHNSNVYEQRINEMCGNNKQSLEITFTHLSHRNPTLAIWIAEEPNLILPILNEVAFDVT